MVIVDNRAGYGFRLFEKTGNLMTTDGTGDKRISLEGLTGHLAFMDNESKDEAVGGRGWGEGESGGEANDGQEADGESDGNNNEGGESMVVGAERKWVGRGAGSRKKEEESRARTVGMGMGTGTGTARTWTAKMRARTAERWTRTLRKMTWTARMKVVVSGFQF